MSSTLRPLAVGTLCLTLLRKDPATAGRVVVVLAREGAMDDPAMRTATSLKSSTAHDR
jgi:hypothetical protein